jgi:hypothetical protein
MPELQRRPGPAARRRRWAGLAVVAAFAALLGAGLDVSLPTEAGAAGCGPAPQGQVATMIVVDRGGVPGARCAIVAQGSTGLDVLRAAGHVVRLDGGFVCAIDGVPATGCGNRPSEGTAYWRYWHAPPGGVWTYSQVGAGGYRLPARCAVEGWVWSDSPSSNTPPSMAAPQVTCEAPVTTSPPPATVRPAAPAPGASGTPAAPAAPAGGSAASGSPAGDVAAGAVPGAEAPGAGPVASVPAAPAEVQGATTLPGESDGSTGTTSASAGTDASESTDDAADGDRVEVAAGSPVSSSGASAPPWGLVVGILLIAGVGGGAWWRSRHDRTENA